MLVSAGKTGKAGTDQGKGTGKPGADSVIRMRSGELHYSEAERLARFSRGAVGAVTAETNLGNGAASTVVADEADVNLQAAGGHGLATRTGVEKITATGHVSVNWPGRRGTGERLVYLDEDGSFTLTGSSAQPPRITDQAHGTVTGSALVFHSHDESVAVEGDGGKTVTETQSPK